METETKLKGKNKINLPIIFVCILISIFSFVLFAGVYLKGEIKKNICKNEFGNDVIVKRVFNSSCEIEKTIVEEEKTFNIEVSNSTENISSKLNLVDVSDIYEKTNPSVVGVSIENEFSREQETIGSGFVISPEGLIATNQHVVSDVATEYFVKFPEITEPVKVTEVYRDAVNDIAILKVDKTDLPYLKLASEDVKLKPGQPVIAIGNPLGELNSTVTSGIISGINRSVTISEGSFLRISNHTFDNAIQTDAAINPGNSGGPLLNTKGEVIGINFATISDADNLSFALPVGVLINRVKELNEFGKFRVPYVGIENRLVRLNYGTETLIGAQITNIDPKGSAKNILEIGDIIIEIDGKTLGTNSVANIIQKLEIGSYVDFEVIRDNKKVIEVLEILEK